MRQPGRRRRGPEVEVPPEGRQEEERLPTGRTLVVEAPGGRQEVDRMPVGLLLVEVGPRGRPVEEVAMQGHPEEDWCRSGSVRTTWRTGTA